MENEKMKVFMIGIGGSSMSGLAEILLEKGMSVYGSDPQGAPQLCKLGVKVFTAHSEKNIPYGTQIVVYSSAIADDNPELKFARSEGLCTFSRGELLGLISRGFENIIAVSGSHGKTTTTAMIAEIFAFAGKNASVHFGGSGGRKRCGNGDDIFLCEACEYKDNFLFLAPTVGVCLNIELDHPDYFKSKEHLHRSFLQFASSSKLFLTSERVKGDLSLSGGMTCEVVKNKADNKKCKADFSARNLKEENGLFSFDFYKNNAFICEISLRVLGVFNVENALFACAVATLFGATPFEIQKGISGFFGVSRRLEKLNYPCLRGEIYCDYAHHPTQIEKIFETFNCKMGSTKKLLAIFQPHTYSRTKKLLPDFIKALAKFENLIITSTYPAREAFDPSGSGEFLAENLENATFISFEDLQEWLENYRDSFETFVFLGAGDIEKTARNFANYK